MLDLSSKTTKRTLSGRELGREFWEKYGSLEGGSLVLPNVVTTSFWVGFLEVPYKELGKNAAYTLYEVDKKHESRIFWALEDLEMEEKYVSRK